MSQTVVAEPDENVIGVQFLRVVRKKIRDSRVSALDKFSAEFGCFAFARVVVVEQNQNEGFFVSASENALQLIENFPRNVFADGGAASGDSDAVVGTEDLVERHGVDFAFYYDHKIRVSGDEVDSERVLGTRVRLILDIREIRSVFERFERDNQPCKIMFASRNYKTRSRSRIRNPSKPCLDSCPMLLVATVVKS